MHRTVSMRTATESLSLQAEAVRDGRGLCSKLQAKRQEDVVQDKASCLRKRPTGRLGTLGFEPRPLRLVESNSTSALTCPS